MKMKNLLGTVFTTATLVALPLAGAFSPTPAYAQGVPVIDSRNLLQQLQTFEQLLVDMGLQEEQISKLIEQIELMEEHLTKLEEIEDLLSDPTATLELALGEDLDGILEGEFDADMVGTLIRGARGDWSGLQGGGADVFREKITAALEGGGTSQDEVTAMANSGVVEAERNATATTTGAATSAAAEVAYEEAAQSVERVRVLVAETANMESLKESVDHNTRVTAELAIAMAAMWQLESVQTMNVGMTGVLDAATLADIEKFTDFTQPDFE
ncbi:conjugal transfer protein TraF [Roseovarius aestuarii]|nr:conjugal transfer protein TraF [Roseovarius aestuarii]